MVDVIVPDVEKDVIVPYQVISALHDANSSASNEVAGDAGTDVTSEASRSATASVTVAKDGSILIAFGAWGRRSSAATIELQIDGVVKASSAASKGHLMAYVENVSKGIHSAKLVRTETAYRENLFRVAIYAVKGKLV